MTLFGLQQLFWLFWEVKRIDLGTTMNRLNNQEPNQKYGNPGFLDQAISAVLSSRLFHDRILAKLMQKEEVFQTMKLTPCFFYPKRNSVKRKSQCLKGHF